MRKQLKIKINSKCAVVLDGLIQVFSIGSRKSAEQTAPLLLIPLSMRGRRPLGDLSRSPRYILQRCRFSVELKGRDGADLLIDGLRQAPNVDAKAFVVHAKSAQS